MDKATGLIISIVSGIIGLAIIAVIVSQRSQAPTVIGSAGSALANVIAAAVSPVTGNSVAPNVGSGGGGGGGLGGFLGGGSAGGDPLSMLSGFGAGSFNPMSMLGSSGFGGF